MTNTTTAAAAAAVFGIVRKNQDNTDVAARKLGVKVNSRIHSPEMSVGAHGFCYAVYDLVGDDRLMVESFTNTDSRHARRYAAVLVDGFEPSIDETAYRDANEIYRVTDELGIGFEDLVNPENA